MRLNYQLWGEKKHESQSLKKVAFVVDKITWVMKRSSLCGYFEPNYDDLIIFESVLKFEFSIPPKNVFLCQQNNMVRVKEHPSLYCGYFKPICGNNI